MTDIGKINVGQTYKPQENKVQEDKCPVCEDCHEEDAPQKEINLNDAPSAAIGQSMVKRSQPYKFDPKKVEEDVKTFMNEGQAYVENAEFAKAFQKEVTESYINEGMSENEAEHWGEIAAQCLTNPTIYNR